MHAEPMRVIAALIASCVALSVAVPQTADACLNPVRLSGNKAVKKVRALEDKLRAGKNDELVRESWRFDIADPALRARAELIVTVAAMRSNSQRVPRFYWEMRAGEESDDSPLARLRKFAVDAPENPLILARIAEGLVRIGPERDVAEATKIIEDLATRDLMPDPEAWVTLAQVRDHGKDTAGRDAAIKQCKKVARWRKAVCIVPRA